MLHARPQLHLSGYDTPVYENVNIALGLCPRIGERGSLSRNAGANSGPPDIGRERRFPPATLGPPWRLTQPVAKSAHGRLEIWELRVDLLWALRCAGLASI